MSKPRRSSNIGPGRQRRISVRAVRRNPPDLRRLSRALIQMAMAQAEAEAAAQAEADTKAAAPPPDAEEDTPDA